MNSKYHKLIDISLIVLFLTVVAILSHNSIKNNEVKAVMRIPKTTVTKAIFDFKGLNYDVELKSYDIYEGVVEITTIGNKTFILSTNNIILYSE